MHHNEAFSQTKRDFHEVALQPLLHYYVSWVLLEVAVARVLRVSDGYQIRADRKWCDRFAIAVAMEEST